MLRNTILRNLLAGLSVFFALVAHSQNVGINFLGSTPNASAILDLNTGSNGHVGFLAPQVSLVSNTDNVTIALPATGLIVYNTNAGMTSGNGKGYYYWNGGAWAPVSTVGNWTLTGNSGTIVGTNYLGTNDANALEFKVDGSESGWLDYLGTAANSFFGFKAGLNNTGQYNTGLGYEALNANTTGNTNTGVGYGASFANSTGSANTSVGYDALYHNTVNNNTAVGYYALVTNTTGINNTAMGYESDWLLTGNQNGNTSLGAYSLQNNISGWNTAIGYQAGYENTSGSYNTWLGLQSGENAGAYNNSTAIGALSYVAANNVMILGSINGVNTATNDINVGIGTDVPTQKLQVNNGNIFISNYNIGGDAATVGQLQFQGTSTGISTIQAGAQGATNYNYTMPAVAPTVGSLVGVSTYAAPAVNLGYVGQPSGILIGLKVITATQAAVTFDAGTTFIIYKILGGGGAGGGCDFTTAGGCIASTSSVSDMAGTGGGAGSYSEGEVTGITGGVSTYAVTIGAGGVGQAACDQPPAGDGGNTTLTLTGPGIVLTAQGGKCGLSLEVQQSLNTFVTLTGGAGGFFANAGALNVQGGTGGWGNVTMNGTDACESGTGASSIFGGGGSGFEERDIQASTGNPASAYGAGGSGGTYPGVTAVNSTCTGGNGSSGIVIIYEYQ